MLKCARSIIKQICHEFIHSLLLAVKRGGTGKNDTRVEIVTKIINDYAQIGVNFTSTISPLGQFTMLLVGF